MTYYMGIDPGKDGALAILYPSGKIHSYTVMPQTTKDLFDYLRKWRGRVKHIMLEKAQVMGKNGAVSMFNYGVGFGEIRGIITALEIPFTQVTPSTWTKTMCEGVEKNLKTKQRTLLSAQRLFPGHSFLKSDRAKKPHSGIYEAVLLAEYCRRKIK